MINLVGDRGPGVRRGPIFGPAPAASRCGNTAMVHDQDHRRSSLAGDQNQIVAVAITVTPGTALSLPTGPDTRIPAENFPGGIFCIAPWAASTALVRRSIGTLIW